VLLLSYFYQVRAGDGGAVYTGITAAFESCEFAANNASGNVSIHWRNELLHLFQRPLCCTCITHALS
jgi:hypothetical protein